VNEVETAADNLSDEDPSEDDNNDNWKDIEEAKVEELLKKR
jgi:hypothetical protein